LRFRLHCSIVGTLASLLDAIPADKKISLTVLSDGSLPPPPAPAPGICCRPTPRRAAPRRASHLPLRTSATGIVFDGDAFKASAKLLWGGISRDISTNMVRAIVITPRHNVSFT
jgi:hypothetical protein